MEVAELHTRTLSHLLEHILFRKAIEHGGYNEIPLAEINEAIKIAFATTVIINVFAISCNR